jgi:ATP-dependent DNA helicase RecQ
MHPRQIFAQTSFEEPPAAPGRSRRVAAADEGPYDKELFERLREVRKQLATERGLPAYFILHDSALRQMARVYPATEDEFARMPTVGPKKASDFATLFVDAILDHVQRNPAQGRTNDARAARPCAGEHDV